MRGKQVLLCSTDRKLAHATRKLFATCGATLVAVEDQTEAALALTNDRLNLVVVDVDHFEQALATLEKAQARVPTIAMSSGNDLQLLSSIVCAVGVANIVERPLGAHDGLAELLITADKILSDDLFGLEKYLRGKDRILRSSVLTNANDRDTELSALSDFLHEHHAPRHLVPTILNAADEMLTNAMYNAPVDKSGRPCYAATNRRSKISLRTSEHVTLTYGVRKGVFGISVRDQFGRLRLDHLSKSIRRCVSQQDPIEQKAGGAGLGLFLIARTARQFVVNVAPGTSSEVIGLWNLDRQRIKQSHSHHSLHYFEEAYRLQPKRRPSRHALGTCSLADDDNRSVLAVSDLNPAAIPEPIADECSVRLRLPRGRSSARITG